jgi:hypothetical protein
VFGKIGQFATVNKHRAFCIGKGLFAALGNSQRVGKQGKGCAGLGIEAVAAHFSGSIAYRDCAGWLTRIARNGCSGHA